MGRTRSLAVVSEDNLITKIIKSLKSILKIKQESQDEPINRKAMVIKEEKIERKIKKNITIGDLKQMEETISKDITYIDNLDEDELSSLDEYYDVRINELESILNDKKSKYFKLASSKKMQ